MKKVLGLNDYLSGRGQGVEEPRWRSRELSPGRGLDSGPERRWPGGSGWRNRPEFERDLWTERSFFNDADVGVTYAEAPWDARWRPDEWWR